MKRRYLLLALPLLLLPALSACGGYDYFPYVSEIKEDIFLAQTETFSLTLSCVRREYPYIADGIPSPASNVVEISLTGERTSAPYEISVLGEQSFGGEMSFRTYAGDYFYSQSVESFFKDSVSLRVETNGQSVEVVATSVKNERTLSARDALDHAVKAERETVQAMTGSDGFTGEFYIRLLRRDVNYYYVGIIDREGKTLSLLLDSETGEVLARRKSP